MSQVVEATPLASHVDLPFLTNIRTQLQTVLGEDYPENVEQYLQTLVGCSCGSVDQSLTDSENDAEDETFCPLRGQR